MERRFNLPKPMKSRLHLSRRIITNIIIALYLSITFATLFPAIASADMGPQPSLTIHIKNPPDGEYYVDALIQKSERMHHGDENFPTEAYNADMLGLLMNYNEDGWKARLIGSPIQNEPFGISQSTYLIKYMGVPDQYKIIVVTADLKVFVSKQISRNSFNETVTFDLATGEVTRPPVMNNYVSQYITTCFFTLLIELLLLLPFGLMQEWKKALVVNAMTQLILTVITGSVLVNHGELSALIVMVPVELMILIIEFLAYLVLMKGYKTSKILGYTITANFASYFAGVFGYLFRLLFVNYY